MFSTTILDMAVGIVFGFLAISLLTSAAVEAINSMFKLRATDLLEGVKRLVNDPKFEGLAKSLYEHAYVSPLGPGPSTQQAPTPATPAGTPASVPEPSANPYAQRKNLPSYIDKIQFARAMLDVTGLSAAAANAPSPQGDDLAKRIHSAVDGIPNEQIKKLLQGVVDRTQGKTKEMEDELSHWFEVGMDRLGGDFKRRTQLFTFIIAFALAVIVNVDAIRIGTVLWEQPAIAEKLRSVRPPPNQSFPTTPEEAAKTEESAVSLVTNLMQQGVPIGWAPGHFWETKVNDHWEAIWVERPTTIFLSVLGWFVTAVAALFGAAFWFDALQSITRLKGSGPSPDEKGKREAAST